MPGDAARLPALFARTLKRPCPTWTQLTPPRVPPVAPSPASKLAQAMPKVTAPSRPLNGLFAIDKPSGPTSMSLLDRLKPLFAESPLFHDPNGDAGGGRGGKGGRRRRGKQRFRIGNTQLKMGQGGTLDPLASGVLVIGVGAGTKQLSRFLDCTKEYVTTGLLGCSTDSYDSEGAIVSRAPYSHLTREPSGSSRLLSALPSFRGPISQLPPLYSALKMDGKPLFEYAREGKELPRPIERRNVRVDELELVKWEKGGEHKWTYPEKELAGEEKRTVCKATELVTRAEEKRTVCKATELVTRAEEKASSSSSDQAAAGGTPVPSRSAQSDGADAVAAPTAQTTVTDTTSHDANTDSDVPSPAFTLRMTVSSGTYVRCIVHDIGAAVGSAAHVVMLRRTRQGEFSVASETGAVVASEAGTADVGGGGNCIPWDVFERALAEFEEEKASRRGRPNSIGADTRGESAEMETETEGGESLKEWERILLSKTILV